MRQTRTFLMGMVTMALIVSLGVSAMAAYNQNMTVTYSDIKINVNGTRITPKDVSGRVVEPFIYEGTTYLPVRATADAVGYNVSWDQASKTVYLTNGGNSGGNSGGNQGGSQGGNTQAPAVNLVDSMEPYAYSDNNWDIETFPSTGSESITMGGTSYKNALTVGGDQWSESFISYNLSGKYVSLGGTVGIVDGTVNMVARGPQTLSIYGDGVLLKSIEIALDGLPTSFSMDVTGVSALKFQVPEHFNAPIVGVADLKLS